MKNLNLKLWSLIIAILISYFVHSQTNTGLITLIVPVELRNLPASKVVLLPNVSQATITLRAPSHLLSDIAKSPPSFLVYAPEEIGNRYTVSLQEDAINLPPGVNVRSIEPAELEFILDDAIEKKVQVVVPRIGNLGQDLKLKKITINPAEITIKGASTELKNLKTVETAPLDLRSIIGSTEKTLPIRLSGRFVQSQIEKVTINISVEQEQDNKKFSNIPLTNRGTLPKGYELTPKKLKIEITGPKRIMNNMAVEKIIAFVSPTGSKNELTLPITLELPPQITAISINPENAILQKK